MTTLITGGAGFIGRRLAARMAAEGRPVRALVRRPDEARALLPAGVEIARGDMTDPASLRAALAGASAVVHLAARKSDESDIAAVNIGGAENLVAACRAAGVTRVINVSSQATRLPVLGEYGRTKAEGDRVLRASGLAVTTLLPSVVYGPGDPGVFGKIARFTAKYPVVPVLGDGRVSYRPVHLDDLCAVIEGFLDRPESAGKDYHVGGAETVTLEDLIDRLAARAGRRPLKIPLPAPLALLLAGLMAPFFKSPPLSRSNVLGGTQQIPDADYLAAFRELGLTPRPFERGLLESL